MAARKKHTGIKSRNEESLFKNLTHETLGGKEDDRLYFIVYIYSKVIERKQVMIIYYCVTGISLLMALLESYLILSGTDSNIFLQYGCTITAHFVSSIVTIVGIRVGTAFAGLITYFRGSMFTIDSGGQLVRRQIKKQVIMIKIVILIQFSFLVLTILNLIICEDKASLIYLWKWIEKYWPFNMLLLECITFVFVSFEFSSIMLVSWCGYYMILHVRFQIKILARYMQQICEHDDHPMIYQLIDDDKFQGKVRKRLLFCIKRHIILIKYVRRINNIAAVPFHTFVLCGVMFITGELMSYLYLETIDIHMSLYLLSGVMVAVVILLTYTMNGQFLREESETLVNTLCNLEWYNMDTKNRTLFQLFMMNTQKTLLIRTVMFSSLDYNIVLWMLRRIYFLVSILFRLGSLNTKFARQN